MGENQWTWKLAKTIPSSTDVGHEVIEQLLTALTEAAWEGSDLFHVQMAAEEAMVNAVTHGNKKSVDKSVEIEFRVSPECVELRFRDEGEGFSPDEIPDPTDDEHLADVHGRGVFLIRRMMTEVTYNDRGNEVTMVKRKSI
ncbi:MAG: ATP-binding protein [Planctomycetota bacterium]|nr:ATP-binding protein [Planctomycetota bacterium]